jgi:hypothetical protein
LILDGIVNQVKLQYDMLPEDEQAEIARRRFICADCPFNSSNAIANGYKNNRFDEHCIMCGCTITRKTASLEAACGIDCCNNNSESDCTCKDKELLAFNKENKIDIQVKWKAYKPTKNEQES